MDTNKNDDASYDKLIKKNTKDNNNDDNNDKELFSDLNEIYVERY